MDITKFGTDQISIFHLVLDCSASMESDYDAMCKGLKMYKNSIVEFSKNDSNSIAICISRFNDRYTPGDFKTPEDMDISYRVGGNTAMYDAIQYGAKQLDEYVLQVIRENNVRPNVTFLLFTDGESNSDSIEDSYETAEQKIKMLNEMGVNTVFVAFGESVQSELGVKLGFKATIDINDRSVLEKFMGKELSRSTIEQSKNIRSLGSNFFSKATSNESSQKMSNEAKSAIEDRKWLDDLFL